ncbi:hypothetical protein [Polyangium mundeleinium]|uniref:Uncharacterized protein n=1 Tax=Polyangium mundeleinium TaxID=2995306 RepID=A0ABT5EXZ2_9BACT|nr:hypothetical protein [Polyangium mundeleinium]MDC0746693.1 hypothetical protein [Polyangium mundeleinium]
MTKTAPQPKKPSPYGFLALCALALVLINPIGLVSGLVDRDPEVGILVGLTMMLGGLVVAWFNTED